MARNYMRWVIFGVPLLMFLVLVAFLWKGLKLDPREVPSPFIDKPAPEFRLPQLHEPTTAFSNKDMLGKVWLLNVWASWCAACRQEHPILVNLSRQKIVPIYGLDYKDAPSDGKRWLEQFGNPYDMSVVDYDGKVGIDYGVYGVPETFIIDKQGIIRHKVIGPVTPQNLQGCVLPLVQLLNQAGPQDVVTRERVKGCV